MVANGRQLAIEESRDAVERVLTSPTFASSLRARRFLRYIADAVFAERTNQLKESVIGIEVFDRSPSFDPRLDNIVRVEALKLRGRLRQYYRGAGRKDPVVVEIPKGAYVAKFRLRTERRLASKPVAVSAPTIAVLPFINVSSDVSHEYLCDGLADELIGILSRTGELPVISRTSAFALKGKSIDSRTIGRVLGAAFLVEGSVRQSNGHLRVAAQLVESRTGALAWAGTLEGDSGDLWGIPQQIAKAILKTILVKVNSDHASRVSNKQVHPAAFELYLKGRYRAASWRGNAQREALQLFESAMTADPLYPLPHLAKAQSLMRVAWLGVAAPRQVVDPTKAALERALELDPELAEAEGALATLIARHEWRWQEAETRFKRALSAAPYSAEIHNAYAMDYLAPLGRLEEAFAENRRARELDPFSPTTTNGYPFLLLLSRKFIEAETACRQLLAERAEDRVLRVFLGGALYAQGKMREGIDIFDQAVAVEPTPFLLAQANAARAGAGDPGPARALLAAFENGTVPEFVPSIAFAYLYVSLGRIEDALTALERAFENRESLLCQAPQLFTFDPYRNHPRFQSLMAKLFSNPVNG